MPRRTTEKSSKKKSPSGRTLKRRLAGFAAAFLCLYFAYSIISIQISIYREKQALVELERQIYEAQMMNDELRRDYDNIEEYYERIARERLGFTAPGEMVIVDNGGA